jgi:plastocyanin
LSHRRTAALTACALALAIPASASAATKDVNMGIPISSQKAFQKLGAEVNDFFPHGTTIRVGDSVRFLPVGFHNVDLPKKGGKPTSAVVPGAPVAGSVDPAGAPFWFNGQPSFGFSPAMAPAGFGKTFTYTGSNNIQSGLPLVPKPKPMTVKFTKAGRYTFYCDLHPGMTGKVTVRSKGRAVGSARAHANRIKAQVKRDLAIAKKLPKAKPPAGIVDVGEAGKYGIEYFGMLPATTTVPVGTTLTFRMTPGSYETHTATFGPGNIEDPSSFIGKIAKSFEGESIDPAGVYPSDPPPAVATLTPTTHGIGFWSSGQLDLDSASPLPPSNKVTFGAPGTYTFYCVIHTNMKGTVTVQ